MDSIKFVIAMVLGLLLNLPGTVQAHDPWTIQECNQYGQMMKNAARAKEVGVPIDKFMQAAMEYILQGQNSKKPFFVKDDQDMQFIFGGINLTYHKEGTPQEFYDKAYEACINVLVGTKKEATLERPST